MNAKRFWRKVAFTDSCWLWKAAHNAAGYGWFRYDGRNRLAHCVAYELTHDEPVPVVPI